MYFPLLNWTWVLRKGSTLIKRMKSDWSIVKKRRFIQFIRDGSIIFHTARSHPNHFLDWFSPFEQKGIFGQSSHVLYLLHWLRPRVVMDNSPRTYPRKIQNMIWVWTSYMIRLFLYIGFREKHLKFDFVSRKFFMINYLYHIETLRMIWERLLDEIMRSFVDWIQLFMHLVSKSHVKFLNFRDKNGCGNTGTSQTPISKIFVI